jgi:hypothetical protein
LLGLTYSIIYKTNYRQLARIGSYRWRGKNWRYDLNMEGF